MIRTLNDNINTVFLNPIQNSDTFSLTAETILKTISITSGEIESDLTGKTLTISMVATKPIVNASTYTFKIYLNTANTLTNAIQMAILNTVTADTTPYMVRTFIMQDTLNNNGINYTYDSTTGSYNDWAAYGDPLTAYFPIPSPQVNNYYFILTGRRTSATSDTVVIKNFVLEL